MTAQIITLNAFRNPAPKPFSAPPMDKTAWEEGRAAGLRGDDLEANPYRGRGPVAFKGWAWFLGHGEGRHMRHGAPERR